MRSAPVLLLFLLLSSLVSCGPEPSFEAETTPLSASDPMVQILGATQLATYRAALPDVYHKELRDIFNSPLTFWYDKDSMIPSYQDSVGDGSYTPIGARPNAGGRRIIVQQGKRLFTDDGEHWSFPFGVTAGTDRVPNKKILNFLSLPTENGQVLPIVYRTIDDNRARGGLGLHKWTWMFPAGTTLGEVIFLEDTAGALYPVEIRTRKRYADAWAVNAFRPFPRATQLAAAIKQARPSWRSQPSLQALVTHLEDPSTLQAQRMTSPAFNNIITLDGFKDVIPAVGDEQLVKDLLSNTTFASSYGQAWKVSGASTAFAATTEEAFSVVPAQYDAGLLEVREASCVRCHQEAGRAIEDFEPAAVLYGDIWGEDRIFSFHPWDQSRYSTFNTENRQVRPELATNNLVVRYNATTHPDPRYRWIDQRN